VAGHTLQEEQPCFLVQDGVRTATGVTSHILLDIPSEHILNMLLLEPSLHDQLAATVNGTTGTQLSEKESQQVLGLTMQHLRNLGKVGERGLFSSHTDNLWGSHDELLAPAVDHVGVLISHDAEHPRQKFPVGVVTVRLHPGIFIL